MLLSTKYEVGENVDTLYPLHGCRNVLRRVNGVVVAKGSGPNGEYITVKENETKYRSLSLKKLVDMK